MDNSQDLNRDTEFDNEQENLELLRLSDPPIYFEPISGFRKLRKNKDKCLSNDLLLFKPYSRGAFESFST